MTQQLRPHDLIHVRPEPKLFYFEHDADVAMAHLSKLPLVVVRRGEALRGRIPIGVRGYTRSERYGGWMELSAVERVDPPPSLMRCGSVSSMPAFDALGKLAILWRRLRPPWGPTGSVGFELASGVAVVTPFSDLDIQIRANRPLSREDARSLLEATLQLPVHVDVLVETPLGGVALAEYASLETCMLRTDRGRVLTSQPWFNRRPAA